MKTKTKVKKKTPTKKNYGMPPEARLIAYYRQHWDVYIEDYFKLKTWSGMRYVCEHVRKNQRTSIRACHGISKTLTAAAIAVTFLNLYGPSIVITTAPTGNQVKNLLWKEIGSIYSKQKGILNGKADMQQVRITPDWYMIGFSTDKPFRMEGFHGKHILWILDEAKGLPQWVYDAVEGSLTGGFSRLLEISTTDGADQQCPLRIHHTSERAKWNCAKFSAFDSPFVAPEDFPEYRKHINPILYDYGKPTSGPEWPIKLADKIQIITPEYIRDHMDWIAKRPDLWETKILGDFATTTENNIIPIKWIESAVNAKVDNPEAERSYGFDVARMGSDRCVLTPINGKIVEEQIAWGKTKTMESVGKVRQIAGEDALIKVDSCGVGAGVFDRLAEIGQPTIGLDSAAKAFDNKTYFNLKAEMWFNVRTLFEAQYEMGDVLSIPDDRELIEDLSGAKYLVRSDGRIIVESKEIFKKRLGRSPDKGDSFVYGLYEPPNLEYVYEGEATEGEDVFL